MDCELIRANNGNKLILKNMVEYYSYEFSKYYKNDLNEIGKFEIIDVEPFIDNEREIAYLIKKDNKYIGFIMSTIKIDHEVIDELWILPKYRAGWFVYKLLIDYFISRNTRQVFTIISENKRWITGLKYAIKKYKNICTIIEEKEIEYCTKNQKHKFIRIILEPTEKLNSNGENANDN